MPPLSWLTSARNGEQIMDRAYTRHGERSAQKPALDRKIRRDAEHDNGDQLASIAGSGLLVLFFAA